MSTSRSEVPSDAYKPTYDDYLEVLQAREREVELQPDPRRVSIVGGGWSSAPLLSKGNAPSPENGEETLKKLHFFNQRREVLSVRRFRKKKIFGYFFLMLIGACVFAILISFIIIDRREQSTTKAVTLDSDSTSLCDIGLISPEDCKAQEDALVIARDAATVNKDAALYIVTISTVMFTALVAMSFRGQRGIARARLVQSLPRKGLDFVLYPVASNGNGQPSRHSTTHKRTKHVAGRSHLMETMIYQIRDEFERVALLNGFATSVPPIWEGPKGDPQWARIEGKQTQSFRNAHPKIFIEVIQNDAAHCMDSTRKCIQFKRCIQTSWKVFLKILSPNDTPLVKIATPNFLQIEAIIRTAESVIEKAKISKNQHWLWDTYLSYFKTARFSPKSVSQKEYEDFLATFTQLCSLIDSILPKPHGGR